MSRNIRTPSPMNERTKALIKNAAVLGARALRHYKLARDHEALSTLKQALETTAEALEVLEHELGGNHA